MLFTSYGLVAPGDTEPSHPLGGPAQMYSELLSRWTPPEFAPAAYLEIGCGRGTGTQLARYMFPSLTTVLAIDQSPYAVRWANARWGSRSGKPPLYPDTKSAPAEYRTVRFGENGLNDKTTTTRFDMVVTVESGGWFP